MKNIFSKYTAILLFLFSATSLSAQFGSMPPFTIDIQPVSSTNVAGIHSFAFAQSGDKWLIVGGRTNGLHGLNSNDGFPPEFKNDQVIVIDTSSWTSYFADLNQLPWSVADPIRSTNMQYFQDGDNLYMTGGFGYDSVADMFVTFPKLTAIHVNDMINAVINAQPIAPAIRQVSDTNFAVCGGEMSKLYNHYYLCFGHNFSGRYSDPPAPIFTQVYSERIKRFDLHDDGTTITVNNFNYQIDTNNFHRRDLNVGPIIKPTGEMALEAYGGVFRKNVNLPFRNPITIDSTGTSVNSSFAQAMSQYTCANFAIYDSSLQTMYATFLGGISLYNYNPVSHTVVYDSLVPFISDVTTMTTHVGGLVEETVMPVQLSGLLGSNAKFVQLNSISSYSNDVIKFRSLPNTKTLVGYLYGGIRAQAGNFGVTLANDSVYRVYLTPDLSTSISNTYGGLQQLIAYPNPSGNITDVLFQLSQSSAVSIEVTDLTGKRLMKVDAGKMQAGNQHYPIDITELPSGMYLLNVKTDNSAKTIKLIKN